MSREVAPVFVQEIAIFANLSKKWDLALDMAEQDVITPLAPGDMPPAGLGPEGFIGLDARIAQLVEQRIENPRVGGSNPPPGTIITLRAPAFFHICIFANQNWV